MAVYVDPLMEWPRTKKWPFGKACHLIADTLNELHAFARRLGLKRRWFQDGWLPHYDLTEGMRWQAIKKGASEDRQAFTKCFLKWRKARDR